MKRLNLPEFPIKIIEQDGRRKILDIIRKKYIVLTPEEWVRQNFIHFLIEEKNVPATLITVEETIKVNNLTKRVDIAVYNKQGKPMLLVECKSTSIKMSQKVFDQAVRYNMQLHVKYIIVTNGFEHFGCKIDYETQNYCYLTQIPDFNEINS
ncbi:MAG: type I restriction enzyme HsdR N-terminal domain-containing protein [Bacteroidota bacterium]|nr:type I restriction enzyme HsdR N-terminal domain-containing protein [Bacteroidota bacterium]